MRQWLISALAYVFFTVAALAQFPVLPGPGLPVASAAYTGPIDLVAFSNWVGMRAGSSAKRGAAVVNACNIGDATCADISTDATLGTLSFGGTIGGNPCSYTITAGTYVTATGVVTLTMSGSTLLTTSSPIAITGLTGAGSFGQINNGGFTTTTGTTGSTVVFTGPTGLGAITLTGGLVGVCTVKIAYDQAGTNNLSNATIATRPILGQNMVNTSWGIACNATAGSKLTSVSTFAPQNQPYFDAIAANWAFQNSTVDLVTMDNGSFNGAILLFDNSASLQIFGGTAVVQSVTAALGLLTDYQGLWSGASTVNGVNGTEVTGAGGTDQAFAGTTNLVLCNGPNGAWQGGFFEHGFAPINVGSTPRASVNTNMRAAYGGW